MMSSRMKLLRGSDVELVSLTSQPASRLHPDDSRKEKEVIWLKSSWILTVIFEPSQPLWKEAADNKYCGEPAEGRVVPDWSQKPRITHTGIRSDNSCIDGMRIWPNRSLKPVKWIKLNSQLAAFSAHLKCRSSTFFSIHYAASQRRHHQQGPTGLFPR
jgi:hypothetical protein